MFPHTNMSIRHTWYSLVPFRMYRFVDKCEGLNEYRRGLISRNLKEMYKF